MSKNMIGFMVGIFSFVLIQGIFYSSFAIGSGESNLMLLDSIDRNMYGFAWFIGCLLSVAAGWCAWIEVK